MNRRGFWRILEVSLAIFLLAAFFLLLFLGNDVQKKQVTISAHLRSLLDEIAKDPALREQITTQNSEEARREIMAFLGERFPFPDLSYDIALCDLDQEFCGNSTIQRPGNVYVEERFVAGTLNMSRPQRIRIIVWNG